MDPPSNLNARKRRQRPSKADNETASSSAGTIHEISRVKNLLETFLSEQKDAKQVMSPPAEEGARRLLQLCRKVEIETKKDNQEGTVTASRNAMTETEKRLVFDEKYTPAILRLQAFQVYAFRLRYSSYLASLVSQMQRDGVPEGVNQVTPPRHVVPEAWTFFMSQRWDDISKRLTKENWRTALHQNSYEPEENNAPLVHVMQIVGFQSNQSPRRLIEAIHAYAERNSVAHRTLGDLAKEKRVRKLRNELEADLCDLKSAPAVCQGDVPAIRQAILSTARKFFDPFAWDDAQERITICELRDPQPAREEGDMTKEPLSLTEILR